MGRKKENTSFVCENCGTQVKPLTNGSYRNHCPHCLFSKHLDEKPGDRKAECGGMMRPIDVSHHSKKGFQIMHQCLVCHTVRKNKIAVDTVQPDDIIRYFRLIR